MLHPKRKAATNINIKLLYSMHAWMLNFYYSFNSKLNKNIFWFIITVSVGSRILGGQVKHSKISTITKRGFQSTTAAGEVYLDLRVPVQFQEIVGNLFTWLFSGFESCLTPETPSSGLSGASWMSNDTLDKIYCNSSSMEEQRSFIKRHYWSEGNLTLTNP